MGLPLTTSRKNTICVNILTVTSRKWLKEFDATAYITKCTPFFSGSPLLRIRS